MTRENRVEISAILTVDCAAATMVFMMQHNSSVSSGGWTPAQKKLAKIFFMTLNAFLAFILVMTAFSNDAEARRRRRKSKKAPIINEKKLYERIGGAKGLAVIVDDWVRMSLADPRVGGVLKPLTAPEQLPKFRSSLNDQLCELADGPCQYKGPDLSKDAGASANKAGKAANAGNAGNVYGKNQANMQITEEQFLVFADNLFQSMQKSNIAEREKNEMLGRIGEFKVDLIRRDP